MSIMNRTYMNRFTRLLLPALLILPLFALLTGCEDQPPGNYVPQYVVEGFLVVDHPFEGISLRLSQSVTDTFRPKSGVVTDADVRITGGGATYLLEYKTPGPDSAGYYRLADTTVKVAPNTLYALEIRTRDGKVLTAQTLTPGRIAWTKPPRDTVAIPAKTDPAFLQPPDSFDLAWTEVPGTQEFLISVRSLDTLNYGKYLPSPVERANRRITSSFDNQDPRYNDQSRWGFLIGLRTPIVWSAFKWYGKQDVTIWAADPAMVNWFKMTYWTGNAQYDPLLANVKGEGGLGIFGSAAAATKDIFVLMPEG